MTHRLKKKGAGNLKPQQDESVRIEITFSKEQFEILKQAQSLLSHICPEEKWDEVLTTLAQKFNQSKLGKQPRSENISRSDANTMREYYPRTKGVFSHSSNTNIMLA